MRNFKKRKNLKNSFNLKKIKSVFLSVKNFFIKYYQFLLLNFKKSNFYQSWKYKFYQKIISWTLIFLILFNLTFSIPYKVFFKKDVYAENRPFYNLVSIIVDEDIYSWVNDSLKRYARDIESNLKETKVVIVPTPKESSVFDISSLIETLYYEWYKSINKNIDFESKLIWSVFVWNIPIPIVKDMENYSKSILPYTDFENKTYVYSHEKWLYEKSITWNKDIEPEIWHWVINPNKNTKEENIKAINDYFDKNHDYYTWKWLFKNEFGIVNWNPKDEPIESYKPFIFYFDRFREISSVNTLNYKWYKANLDNKEDLVYNRHTKDLAKKIKDQVLWWEEEDMEKLIQEAFTWTTYADRVAKADTWGLLQESPDILTRYATNQTENSFWEIFNFSELAKLRKNIYNAWRYSWYWDEVNAHMIPFIITLVDLVSDQIVKNANDTLEKFIDDGIKNWWQNDIWIFESFSHKKQCEERLYKNYFYGKKTEDIKKAEECSIYRWSLANWWTLIMANRWYNIRKSPDDYETIWEECIEKCKWDTLCMTRWYWWWNSPINIDEESIPEKSLDYDLKEHKLKWAITPLLDVVWSRKSEDASKIHNPWNCKSWVWILTKQVNDECEIVYDLDKKIGFSCDTDVLAKGTVDFNDFTDVADWISVPWTCNTVKIYVGWILYKEWEQVSENWLSSTNCTSDTSAWSESGIEKEGAEENSCDNLVTCIFKYKVVNSQIQHESPTRVELRSQVNWLVWTTLPVDRDKYTDFFWRDDKLKKINYPYLFRLELESWIENNIKNNDDKLKKYLAEQSKIINDTVRSAATAWPGLMAKYRDVDLYKKLKELPLKIYKLNWEEKKINYYDTLVFALYWKNMKDISKKYQYVLENYLSDQFNNDLKYGLPENKKMYEIAYMWAPWDASNMYIKMDPESKIKENPYSNEQSKSNQLDNNLTSLNLWNNYWKYDWFSLGSGQWEWIDEFKENQDDFWQMDWEGEASFDCWPPEWVPIWRWFPAVICRLKTMLPPKIKIWSTNCSQEKSFWEKEKHEALEIDKIEAPQWEQTWDNWDSLWDYSFELKPELKDSETQTWTWKSIDTCEWDFDKNWINDCLEKYLSSWKIDLFLDSSKYYYNEAWTIKAVLKDKDWSIIYDDDYTKINFELLTVDILNQDSTKTTIYDSKNIDLDQKVWVNKYFNFENTSVQVNKWEAKHSFSSKDSDLDVSLRAWIEIKDFKWNKKVFLENSIKLEVRWNNLVTTNYKLEKWENFTINSYAGLDSLLVSKDTNIFIVDWKKIKVEENKNEIDKLSDSKEKIIFSLENYSKSWDLLDLKYPITINLYDLDNNKIINNKLINSWELDQAFPLISLKKSGEYILEISDSEGFKIYKRFILIAEKANKWEINLWSNIAEVWGIVTTNFLVSYDEFWNVVAWDLYDVEATIWWKWVKFIQEKEAWYEFVDKLNFQMLEWFKVFRLKTTDNIWNSTVNFSVKDSNWSEIFKSSADIKTIKDVKLYISPKQSSIKIWWWEYGFDFSVRDLEWKVVSDLNSRLYLHVNDIYWKPTKAFVDVKNWTGQVDFTTKNLSWKWIKLSFQIEWLKKIYTKHIDILPEKPIKIDLIPNKNKLEANKNDYINLRVELKDRYWNLVFNDNSTNFELDLKDQFKDILKPQSYKIKAKNWIWVFKINATEIPWTALLMVKANPWFTSSFSIKGQWAFPKENLTLTWFTLNNSLTELWEKFFEQYDASNYIFKIHKIEDFDNIKEFKNITEIEKSELKDFWNENNKIDINSQDQAIISLESFYFWNKDKIEWKHYNSLYTVLLWAEYWDVDKKDYLAWSMLFDKENRSLAVTSLLNNPYNYYDIVSVNSKWKILTIENNEDLTQDIRYISNIWEDKKLSFDIYNDALSTHIWKIYFNLDKDNKLKLCENDWQTNFIDCEKDKKKTSILLKSLSKQYSSELIWSKLVLKDIYLNDIFSINTDWEIFLNNNFTIENFRWNEETWKNDESIFLIKAWDENIWAFSFNIVNWKINLSRDENLLDLTLNSEKNAIIVYLNSNKYWDRLLNTKDSNALMIYYNDPFSDENELNIFSSWDNFNFESFKSNYKVWWSEWNKSMLLFAAWETVWESTRKYASFSIINLWDPVVSLKKVKVELEQKKDEAPECEEIKWLDWNICDREEVWSLDLSISWWQINLKQEITEILADQSIVVEVPVVANPWIIMKKDWEWIASTWERMAPNQQKKGLNAVAWDHIKKPWIPTNWRPEKWQVYWFLVSWLVRMWASNEKIKSPISWIKWWENTWSEEFINDWEEDKKYRSFDKSTWIQISKDNDNIWYKTFDYNADWLQDLVVLKSSSYLELFENRWDFNFLSQWNLLYIPEIWSKWQIEAWDFTWDKYEDIFFVSKWKPFILSNNEKKFTKISLEENFWLTWSIVKTSSFDMDNDKKKDLVIMDSEGDLYIFYWSWTSDKPEFTKLKIWSWYSIFLNNEKKDWNWAISYEWIKKIDYESRKQDLLESNKELEKDWIMQTDQNIINTNLIDGLIYENISIETKKDKDNTFREDQLNDKNFKNSYLDVKTEITNLQDYSNTNIFSWSNDNIETTFVKNKYVNNFWFNIQKKYTDLSSWSLNPLDMLEVTVEIKNTWQAKKKVFYAEDIEDYFSFSDDENDIVTSKEVEIKHNVWNYAFMIGPFDMSAWETLKLTYKVQLAPMSYWEIKTWYFEDWEAWDDEYGDVILKINENVCSNEPHIFRSTWARSYEKWIKELTCEESDLEFPKEIEKNTIDEDNNWVPDYIDKLIPTEEQRTSWRYGDEYIESVKDYWKKSFRSVNKDKDWDWIPTSEDKTPSYSNNDKDPQAFLNTINEWIDTISSWIDYVSQGLCNWFWWWACIWTPINWAPLAPWNDPVMFWYPIWDWLKTWEWLPLFSAMTDCWKVRIWPPCPNWAWWWLDKDENGEWISFIRFFITPTLTWAMWLAICFWKNNMSKDRNPPWAYPLLKPRDWDCIIAAFPLLWCSWDWSDWDVKEKNYPINFSSQGGTWESPLVESENFWNWKTPTPFSAVNWSCIDTKEKVESRDFRFDDKFVGEYLNYKETKSEASLKSINETFNEIHKWDHVVKPSKPLIKIWEKWSTETWSDLGISVDINTSWLRNWDYKDVIKVKNTLIKSFNDYFMDWIDRQIEEVIVKLTSFPSLIIVLPNFSSITDYEWTNFFSGLKDAYLKNYKEPFVLNQEEKNSRLSEIENKMKSNKCWSENENTFECYYYKLEELILVAERDYNPNIVTSWIRWVYDFIWSLPLLKLEAQRVNINLPWITQASLLKAKISYEMTLEQWNEEKNRALKNRSKLNPKEKAIWDQIIVDTDALIRSLQKNMEVIETYKKYPEDLIKLLNKKEDRLNQVICNMETLYNIYWGWLKDNWKRFKAWVELYILIKAVLKSWQVILDLFDEYEKTCVECKNERYDLRTFIWRLISMIIPKIPVIEFPKWPNIILDLHNIRVWFVLALPEFNFNSRPIVLPELPKLHLPDIPTVNIKIPSLPILPSIEIPELPDLPNIPTVELPNLPPPPKLPKLLSAIELVFKLAKLITKVQCILQKTPFAPEWNAWVKIAYLTDRQAFSSFDFIDIKFPQFSFPFVDSIDVTTYLNFEIDSQFIVEFAKNWVKSLNNFTNNVVNLFNNRVPSLDFSNTVPKNINIELDKDWVNISPNIDSLKNIPKKIENKAKEISPQTYNENSGTNSLRDFIIYWIYNIYNYLNENKNEKITSKELLTTINNDLSKPEIISDPSTEKLRNIWKEVNSMTYSKEDKHIKELQDRSKEKFDTIIDIMNQEIEVNKKQIEELKNIDVWNSNIKLLSNFNESNVEAYNELLKKHNLITLNSIWNLFANEDKELESIKKEQSKLINNISWRIENTKTKLLAEDTTYQEVKIWSWELAYSSTWSCAQYSQKWLNDYKYNYKWIYIIENWKNYRLFDYIDELSWKEEINHVDFDNDWDEDIIYMYKNEIYTKENLQLRKEKNYEVTEALTLYRNNNKFYKNETYYESLNNAKESSSSDWYVSLSFETPENKNLNNFRLEYYTIVDKFLNEDYDNYIPDWIKKSIIDNFEDPDKNTILEKKSQTWYTIRKNLAFIKWVWNNISDSIELKTVQLNNIKDSVWDNKIVNLSSNTKLYAWKNSFTIWYYIDNREEQKEIKVDAYNNINFDEGVKVFSIKWNAYVETKNDINLKWQKIKDYLDLPILQWTEIKLDESIEHIYTEASHIDIEYYDQTKNYLDFRDIKTYKLNILWARKDSHFLYVKEDNDYYYSKISSFNNNIFSTKSNQILLAPQTSSDTEVPEINLNSSIKIPVYQTQRFDFTPYIFDNTWFKDFYIDYDLETDSDNDWDKTNDRDSLDSDIFINKNYLAVNFWPYNNIFTQKIWLNLFDLAWNKTYKQAELEVYSPVPEIDSHSWSLFKWRINEELTNEPINLYRYRSWTISKLLDKDWKQKVYTSQSWSYEFDINLIDEKWLQVTKNWLSIAKIDENTWKISLNLLNWSEIKVLPSNHDENDKKFAKIILNDDDWMIYYEYFDFSSLNKLNFVRNFEEVNSDWIFVKLNNYSDYWYYQLPFWIPHNPWVISIYSLNNKDKLPLFSIFPNWEIHTAWKNYSLEYWTYKNNVIFKLYNQVSKEYVWEVLMKINDWNYVIK